MTTFAQVRVVRSARRRRTVTARVRDGVLEVLIPAWMSAEEEGAWVARMQERVSRSRQRTTSSDADLMDRARALLAAHAPDIPPPVSVRWVTNQQGRWGSCTPAERTVRISHRLQGMPLWVVDYVLMHELAHLAHADHGPDFWDLVQRYPLTERARGFLDGVSFASDQGLSRSPEGSSELP